VLWHYGLQVAYYSRYHALLIIPEIGSPEGLSEVEQEFELSSVGTT
jgi:hypothetical protein